MPQSKALRDTLKVFRAINKAGKKSNRQLKSASKAVSSISKSAKTILTKQLAKKKSATVSRLKQRRGYSVRDLPIPKQKNFAAYIKYIETHAKEIDKLKEKNEYWAAKMFGAKTWLPYSHIDLLLNKLNQYEAVQQLGSKGGKHFTKLIENIQFIKVEPEKLRKVKAKEFSKRPITLYKKEKYEEVARRESKVEKEKEKGKRERQKRKVAEKKQREEKKKREVAEAKYRKERAERKKLEAQLKKQKKQVTKKRVKRGTRRKK